MNQFGDRNAPPVGTPVAAASGAAREDHPDSRRHAVALRYRETDSAPHVVAKGYGNIAQTIIDRAGEHGLYVHRSPDLVRLLMRVDLDDRIPPELYLAVAELLAWVYQLETAASET